MLMQPRRFGRWVVLAIVVIFVFKAPDQAAHLAQQLWGLSGQAIGSLARFVTDLRL
jgi:hypothetical protein